MPKSLPPAIVISIALVMLWVNWAQAIQAILLLFAFGSFVVHVWLSVTSVMKRLKERELGMEQVPPVQEKGTDAVMS